MNFDEKDKVPRVIIVTVSLSEAVTSDLNAYVAIIDALKQLH